jgi:hypothetical protein
MPKEYTKSDFNLDNLYPDEFEVFCCDFLSVYLRQEIGYIRHFPEGKDGGIDGFYEDTNKKIILQVKKHEKPLSEKELTSEKEKMDIQKPTDYYFFVSHELAAPKIQDYSYILQPHIDNSNKIFDRKKIFYELRDYPKKYNNLINKWLNNLAEISTYFKNKQLEIESAKKIEEIEKKSNLKEKELSVTKIQLNNLINTFENVTGEKHFIGIESRTENKPNLSEPILFSEYYQDKVKTYYQTQDLTPEQLPGGGFTLDFSKDGGKELQNDLKLYFKGQKDTVKITNKFLKNVKLQVQGKPIFEHNPNHGYLDDQQVALELLQPYERIKIRIDTIDEIINYPNLDHLEAIIWHSVETGNPIIQNAPLLENPKIKFKFEIDLSSNDDNVKLKIDISILNNNLKNFEEALIYYKLYERILSKKWELKIIKNNVVQFSLPNKLPQQELDEGDFVFIKKLEIMYKVWKYFEQDFRRLRIDEKLFALEYPYNLDQDSAQTISLLYNKISDFSFEFNTILKNFLQSYFIDNNVQDSDKEKVKQNIIKGFSIGQSLYIQNFEIKPMPLFGKSLTLKIAGNAFVKIENVDDVNIKQIIKFLNPKVKLEIHQE